MKVKAPVKKVVPVQRVEAPKAASWWYYTAAAVALVVMFWAYGPALHGEFLFDDYALSFTLPASADAGPTFHAVRPVLQFTYWLNTQLSREDTFSYHVLNLLIHYLASIFIFLIVMRLAEWNGAEPVRKKVLACLAAFLFLLHPAQTEAVAYLAGRSESLSTMFALAAFTVFLYRKENATTWVATAEVMALFGLALLSKEQTMALPGLLLLTDLWWNPGFSWRGAKDNWRLYGAMAVAAACGLAFFWQTIMKSTTAGIGLKDFTWYQYLFTEFRALFVYLREFVLPVNLNADWDFPISKTIFDHGAVFGLVGLVALCGVAWALRKRFRLASYGFFAYLILMAPTSSVLKIQDPVAERRLYFSMVALLLIVVDLASRVKIDYKQLASAGAVVLLGAAVATHARAEVWSSPMALWQDTVQKSPNKQRVRFQLAFAYYTKQDYGNAIAKFAEASQVGAPRADLYLDWGLSYQALHETDKALEKLSTAAAISPTAHVYSQIGMVNGSAQRWSTALDALNHAEQIDGNYALTYFYRGLVYYNTNQCDKAVQDYKHALTLDPAIPDGNAALRQAAACAGSH